MSTEVDPTERLASLGAGKQVTEDLLSTEDNFSSLLCTALLETWSLSFCRVHHSCAPHLCTTCHGKASAISPAPSVRNLAFVKLKLILCASSYCLYEWLTGLTHCGWTHTHDLCRSIKPRTIACCRQEFCSVVCPQKEICQCLVHTQKWLGLSLAEQKWSRDW